MRKHDDSHWNVPRLQRKEGHESNQRAPVISLAADLLDAVTSRHHEVIVRDVIPPLGAIASETELDQRWTFCITPGKNRNPVGTPPDIIHQHDIAVLDTRLGFCTSPG